MDMEGYFRFVLALIFVIGLIGLCVVIVRKLGIVQPTTMMRGKQRRMAIAEILPLDHKRRVVLFRCDDREHLVVLGPTSETLIAADMEAKELPATPPIAPITKEEHST